MDIFYNTDVNVNLTIRAYSVHFRTLGRFGLKLNQWVTWKYNDETLNAALSHKVTNNTRVMELPAKSLLKIVPVPPLFGRRYVDDIPLLKSITRLIFSQILLSSQYGLRLEVFVHKKGNGTNKIISSQGNYPFTIGLRASWDY